MGTNAEPDLTSRRRMATAWRMRSGHLPVLTRRPAAFRELELVMEDNQGFPINCNHYYTDTVFKRPQVRQKDALAQALASGTEHHILEGCKSIRTSVTAYALHSARVLA